MENALLFYTNGYPDALLELKGLRLYSLAEESRRGNLFLVALCVSLTPLPNSAIRQSQAIAIISQLWLRCGTMPVGYRHLDQVQSDPLSYVRWVWRGQS
jgi:hypothetical protein